MNAVRVLRCVAGKLLWLPLAGLLSQAAAAATAVDETFDVLQCRTGTYTNVTVTKKTKSWIMILHSRGIVNIKLADLAPSVLQKLGYATDPQKTAASAPSTAAEQLLPNTPPPASNQTLSTWREQGRAELAMITATPTLLYAALGMALLFYLFFCYCNMLICRKAHNEPGPLVWLPVLQLFPLLRAAGMSRMWFVAFLVPVINILAQIVWYVNIVKARGKSLWVALLLLLPFTGPFAFLYLAFSSPAPFETQSASQSLVLETS